MSHVLIHRNDDNFSSLIMAMFNAGKASMGMRVSLF